MSLSNGDRIGNYEVTAPIEKGGIEEPDVLDKLSLPVIQRITCSTLVIARPSRNPNLA